MEVRFISNSARPLTRPGRCTRRISPCTKVPGGITMRLFMVMGNEVCAYTGSPARALLVVMPCFKMSGIFLPAGTVTVMDCRAAPLSLEAAAEPEVTCGWLCPGVTAVEPTLALAGGLGAVLGVSWGCLS